MDNQTRLLESVRELWDWYCAMFGIDACPWCKEEPRFGVVLEIDTGDAIYPRNPDVTEIEHMDRCPFKVLAEVEQDEVRLPNVTG